ncbi:MAG: DUF29 family protein [Microcystis aeruginosa DA14]|uniref:DUF29 family protein n=1 Tax=Microcystis aeruginosa DA14 TaxID=1987506 RepID=A0A3E0MDM3_MICAE|nr:MAG: DUF29 family protein [Microcystis aeruginosa DA14]
METNLYEHDYYLWIEKTISLLENHQFSEEVQRLIGFQLFLLINTLHTSYQVSKRATPLLPNHYSGSFSVSRKSPDGQCLHKRTSLKCGKRQ